MERVEVEGWREGDGFLNFFIGIKWGEMVVRKCV